MRVLVCGGRDYADFAHVCHSLNRVFAEIDDIDVVIHGAATGADTLAKEWAESHDIKTEPFPAVWDDLTTPPVVIRRRKDGSQYNAAAGGIRNQRMIDEGNPDLVVAFPGGNGTADMIRRAREAGIRVIEFKAKLSA